MLQTQTAYKQGQWSQAGYALQAQRLAPQSAETFLYLSMIANRQNKPANAGFRSPGLKLCRVMQ